MSKLSSVTGHCFLVFRGVKGFFVEIGDSQDGPWTKVVEGEFSDPSQNENITEFPLIKPQTGQFVNLRCVSWYGRGCLLQYIGFGQDGEYHIYTALALGRSTPKANAGREDT